MLINFEEGIIYSTELNTSYQRIEVDERWEHQEWLIQ